MDDEHDEILRAENARHDECDHARPGEGVPGLRQNPCRPGAEQDRYRPDSGGTVSLDILDVEDDRGESY